MKYTKRRFLLGLDNRIKWDGKVKLGCICIIFYCDLNRIESGSYNEGIKDIFLIDLLFYFKGRKFCKLGF